MTSIQQARELLQQCMTMAYEAYGKYYSGQYARGIESVLNYHQWLEVEGCGWKSLVKKQQNMLITLIYESNIRDELKELK